MINPIDGRLADLDERLFMPRELSWLSFNARVLQEAANESVPVIQRLRYLGIFSSNLDEFFRVRVAEIRRLITLSTGGKRQRAKELLETIQEQVAHLQQEFDRTQSKVMAELKRRHIYIIDETELSRRPPTSRPRTPTSSRRSARRCRAPVRRRHRLPRISSRCRPRNAPPL